MPPLIESCENDMPMAAEVPTLVPWSSVPLIAICTASPPPFVDESHFQTLLSGV